jgi:hypothetical protein
MPKKFIEHLSDVLPVNKSLSNKDSTTFELYLDKPVARVTLSGDKDVVTLENIWVSAPQRGRGSATFMLKLLLSLADIYQLQIEGVIEANSGAPVDNEKLAKWYKSVGFVVSKHWISYFPKTMYS